jgi:hypothetical protein
MWADGYPESEREFTGRSEDRKKRDAPKNRFHLGLGFRPSDLLVPLLFGMVAVRVLGGCSLAGLEIPYEASVESEAGADVTSEAGKKPDACALVEDCANGVDDDCNGLVDCADPACQKAGFACTASAVPSGWTLIAYDGDARPTCPMGFGAEQAVVSAPSGAPAACSCHCSGSSAECVGTTVYNKYPNSCATGTSSTVNVNNGQCTAISTSLESGYAYQLDQLGPEPTAQQGSCTGSGAVSGSLPKVNANAGATCDVSTPSSAGCSAGTMCAPPREAPFQQCISHPGSVSCPTFGFSKQTLVSTGDPGYVDTRACGTCPCATSLGCGATSLVTLYDGAGCTGGSYGIVIECPAPIGATQSIASYKVGYSTTGSASCQPTGSSAPTGGVALDSHVETICCTP